MKNGCPECEKLPDDLMCPECEIGMCEAGILSKMNRIEELKKKITAKKEIQNAKCE